MNDFGTVQGRILDAGSKRGPEASDKPSDNASRQRQTERDAFRHRFPPNLR